MIVNLSTKGVNKQMYNTFKEKEISTKFKFGDKSNHMVETSITVNGGGSGGGGGGGGNGGGSNDDGGSGSGGGAGGGQNGGGNK